MFPADRAKRGAEIVLCAAPLAAELDVKPAVVDTLLAVLEHAGYIRRLPRIFFFFLIKIRYFSYTKKKTLIYLL